MLRVISFLMLLIISQISSAETVPASTATFYYAQSKYGNTLLYSSGSEACSAVFNQYKSDPNSYNVTKYVFTAPSTCAIYTDHWQPETVYNYPSIITKTAMKCSSGYFLSNSAGNADSSGQYCTKESCETKTGTYQMVEIPNGSTAPVTGCYQGCSGTNMQYLYDGKPWTCASGVAGAGCSYNMQFDGNSCSVSSDSDSTASGSGSGDGCGGNGFTTGTLNGQTVTVCKEAPASGSDSNNSTSTDTGSGTDTTSSATSTDPTTVGDTGNTSGTQTGTVGGGTGSLSGDGYGEGGSVSSGTGDSGSGTGTGTGDGSGTGSASGASPTDQTSAADSTCPEGSDSLACATMDSPSADDLPSTDAGWGFTQQSAFGGFDNASCPASIVVMTGVEFSFENLCSFFQRMRPFVLGIAWLIAAYIATGSRNTSGGDD